MNLIHSLRPRLPPRYPGYKPKAIRIHSLLSLFFLFVICLVSIELLVQRTRRPTQYLGFHKYEKAASLEQCPAPDRQAAIMSSLSSQSASLCSQYTIVYKPFTTSLTPSLMTNFDSWLDLYNSVSSASESAAACTSLASSASSLSSATASSSNTRSSSSSSSSSNSLSNTAVAASSSASNSASSSLATSSSASSSRVTGSITSNAVGSGTSSSRSTSVATSVGSTATSNSRSTSSIPSSSTSSSKGTFTSTLTTSGPVITSSSNITTKFNSTTVANSVEIGTPSSSNTPTPPTDVKNTTGSIITPQLNIFQSTASTPVSPITSLTSGRITGTCTYYTLQPALTFPALHRPKHRRQDQATTVKVVCGNLTTTSVITSSSTSKGSQNSTTTNVNTSSPTTNGSENSKGPPTSSVLYILTTLSPASISPSSSNTTTTVVVVAGTPEAAPTTPTTSSFSSTISSNTTPSTTSTTVTLSSPSTVTTTATSSGMAILGGPSLTTAQKTTKTAVNIINRRSATASVVDIEPTLSIGNETLGTPLADAWNYLIWTSPLGVRRTTNGIVTTTSAAVFTLDVFNEPDGKLLTSWPTFTATPVLALTPTTPACIPITIVQPAAIATGGPLRRDTIVTGGTNAIKPYVTRQSTTVVVLIRNNYLDLATNLPTITRTDPVGLLSAVPSGMYAKWTQGTSVVQTTDSHGGSTTYSMVVVQATTVSGTQGATAFATLPPAPTWTPEPLANYERIVNPPFTPGSYFGALYMAPVVAVLIKVLFESIIAANKMMEPFERLHSARGATAEESLFSQYLESSISLDAFKWDGLERSLPLWTILMYAITTIAAPLASSAMSVRPMDSCFLDELWRKCDPAWILNMNFIRLLECLLVACLLLTVLQLYSSWHFHAGVPCNPTSIASMAVMLNYEPLIETLQSVDGDANEEQLLQSLKPFHYWLGTHSPSSEEPPRYGILHRPNAVEGNSSPRTIIERGTSALQEIMEGMQPSRSGKTILLDSVHASSLLVLSALLTTYRTDLRNNSFNYFFASNSWGPKLIMVALGSIIDTLWKNLEREVRLIEPYRRLSHGNCRPEATILTKLNGSCWSNTHSCFRNVFKYPNMWFEAVIGATAVLSDVNIIALSGVLMSDSQTQVAYDFSSITSICLTSYMLIVMGVTTVWWRRTHIVSSMPRVPETVAVVLTYLCSSRMTRDMAAARMENMSELQRNELIISSGRRYRFGLSVCDDGKERWCVDYDDNAAIEAVVTEGSHFETNMEKKDTSVTVQPLKQFQITGFYHTR